ncbi:helicase protein MOM1-like protein isoform X1, partial [Tanacetum coccineum]
VGCSLKKSSDGESIEYGNGEGSSSESEKSPKKQKTNHSSGKQHELNLCETFSSEEIQKETTQENNVQVNQTIGAGKVDQLNPEGSSLQLGMGQCSPSVASTYSDPLQYELEKLCESKNNILKFYEVEKLQLKSNHEKELAEVIAEMNRKYEAKCQDAEAAFQSKMVEIDASFNKVVNNKILADAFRSKCPDMSPFDPAVLRVQSGGMRFQGQPSMGRSASLSPAQVSRIPQQPPLQIVHQSANLFPSAPTRPLSNTNPFSIPIRPPPINPITPSTRPPSSSGPMTPFIRFKINSITPSNRPPPNIKSITLSSRPPASNNPNPNAAFSRNPRAISGLRAPAPHIRSFTPSTSTSPHNLSSHRMMSSHHASSPTSQSLIRPPHLSQLHTPPHLLTNHNGHPTQNSPTTQPFSSLSAAQISSQSPAASLALPPLYSWHPSEQHPPGSLPAMSSSLPETSLPPTPRDPESRGKYPKLQPPPPSAIKDDDDGLDDEDDDEHGETLCGSCGESYVSGEFWICCDICERWFHGKCVKITPARAKHVKQYKCPTCSNKRACP